MAPRSEILIGTSGFAYPHWRDRVYQGAPERRWLELYTGLLPTVELNATFYRLPSAAAVQKWADQSPEGFIFAVKVSRYLTHIRRLEGVADGLARLLPLLAPLRDAKALGPLLWQLPPGFRRDDRRLAAALAELPPGRHAFEFRDASWFCPDVYRALERGGVSLVIADDARRRYGDAPATADWRYLRFHYGSRGRRGNYSAHELDDWARRIEGYAREGDVYAYFNNDWEGFAVRNAAELARRLAAPGRAAA